MKTDDPIALQPTGIATLDEILQGGLPFGTSVIFVGAPGTGKTLLAQQWLFSGLSQYKEPGLYLSFTESNRRSLRNLQAFSFYKQSAVGPGKVHFTDLRLILEELAINMYHGLNAADMGRVIDVIRHMVDTSQSKRVVIDSLSAILALMPSDTHRRQFLFLLNNALANLGATTVLIIEAPSLGTPPFGVAEYIADGIIHFANDMGQQSMVRRLNILKLRGSNFRSGQVIFDISDAGIRAYPKIPNYSLTAQTDFQDRVSTGVPGLDELIDGGIPRGHIVLLGGNTGTGKTTLTTHFVAEGIKQGEPAVYVALEESVVQIKKTAAQHGWDLERAERQGKLTFVTTELIDLYPDRLLYAITDAVKQTGAKRVVIDSISSMENAAFDATRIREFLLQILAYFKSEGITCIMTYLTPEMFNSSATQLLGTTTSTELGLSSMVDGIILLRYVERDQTVKRLVSVLKLRGSGHHKAIFEYDIEPAGFKLKGEFHG